MGFMWVLSFLLPDVPYSSVTAPEMYNKSDASVLYHNLGPASVFMYDTSLLCTKLLNLLTL
jgi:hypothetical protein